MARSVSTARVQSDAGSPKADRAPWERPALRRLAANQAKGGTQPCNDGSGVGGCDNFNHS